MGWDETGEGWGGCDGMREGWGVMGWGGVGWDERGEV